MSPSTRTTPAAVEVAAALPGDDLVPGADFVLDRAATLPATPEQLWPWLVQCGKGRAGWYAPRSVEHFIPRARRGLHHIEPDYQHLEIGDVEPDWGPGSPTFTVEIVDPPHDLVYSSQRGHLSISWALHVSPIGPDRSRFQSRLRMGRDDDKPGSRPLRVLGDGIDWLTITWLVAGLRERLLAE